MPDMAQGIVTYNFAFNLDKNPVSNVFTFK